ncbi:hypothetical protein BGY98DRAFT_1081331 [Russula aff. rugulosa BPL654]|nr:hypothetical protein BGY98DRAFT_1081331 [Russula aff. rugulosa BPL654]
MDSQAKCTALVRGDGVVALVGIRKTWVHAPGSLLVEEAGGIIPDLHGRPLDIGTRYTLWSGCYEEGGPRSGQSGDRNCSGSMSGRSDTGGRIC